MESIKHELKKSVNFKEKEVEIYQSFGNIAVLEIYHGNDSVIIDKSQAKDLLEILKGFIDD